MTDNRNPDAIGPSSMMKAPHMDDGLLDRLARRDVSEAELRRIEEHLASCADCAQKARDRAAASLESLRDHFLEDAPAPLEHPSREELARYARRHLDPAATEIVESHFDECADCERLAARLRMQRRVGVRRTWLAVAAAATIAAALLAFLLTRTTTPPTGVRPVVKSQPPNDRATPRTPEPIQIANAYENPEWNELVRDATESGKLPLPSNLNELRASEDVVRGSGGEIGRVSPAGKVIDDVRPEFSWPSREPATYTVFIFDGDREIARSASLNASPWRVPMNLPRGRILTWQVEAVRGDTIDTIPRPPAPPARFQIIREQEQNDLIRAREAHPQDDLLLGLLYARAGMLERAKTSLQRASEKNPVAQKLLASLPKG